MVFCNSSGPIPGPAFAFPDVVKLPPFAIPAPMPDISLKPMAIPTQVSTFLTCMPAHNIATMVPMTNGDNAGVMLGVVSNITMGPERPIMGSTNLMFGCMPATRALVDPTGQNGFAPNAIGIGLPTQATTMSLR